MTEETGKKTKGAGKNSFDLVNRGILSDILPVNSGSVVLGPGEYSYLAV